MVIASLKVSFFFWVSSYESTNQHYIWENTIQKVILCQQYFNLITFQNFVNKVHQDLGLRLKFYSLVGLLYPDVFYDSYGKFF